MSRGTDLRYFPDKVTPYTQSMREKAWNQQFLETWTVKTELGLEFEVPIDSRYIILRKNEEPKLVNARSLSMVMYLYPNAHTVYPISEMVRVSPAAQIINFKEIEEKLNESYSSRNIHEKRRQKEQRRR